MTGDLEHFALALERALADAPFLEDLEAWLRSQPGVRRVSLSPALLKSDPPQRDFTVEIESEGGAPVTKIVNVYDLGDAGCRLHTVRDPAHHPGRGDSPLLRPEKPRSAGPGVTWKEPGEPGVHRGS